MLSWQRKLSDDVTVQRGRPSFIASQMKLSPRFISSSSSAEREVVYSRIGYIHTSGPGSSAESFSAFSIWGRGSFTQESGRSPYELSIERILKEFAASVLPSLFMRDIAIGR